MAKIIYCSYHRCLRVYHSGAFAILYNRSASRQAGRTQHTRNPRTGQWKEHFTPKVSGYFERHFANLLARYGYA